MMKRVSMTVATSVVCLVAAACGGGTDGAATSIVTTTLPPGPSASPGAELTLTAPPGATYSGFAETQLSVAADVPFSIRFDNADPDVLHNVQIFQGTTTTGPPVWAPVGNAMITGVDRTTYQVPALAAGTYTYNCLVHPATMVGTLTVG
jgi:plastocyanin